MTPDPKILAQEMNARARSEREVQSNREIAEAIRKASKPGWVAIATLIIAAATLVISFLQIVGLLPKISN